MHGTCVKVNRQIHQVFDFARTQARCTHIVHLELQNMGRCHGCRQRRKTVPHGLCRLDRYLLSDDAARQGAEGITPRLQAGIAKLGNQPFHDAVFCNQVPAGIQPVVGCDVTRR